MKYHLLIITTALLLSACDINESMRTNAADSSTSDARVIAAKSGCMGCHAVSNSVYGPAWKLVSKRYQGVPDAHAQLTAVIRSGSAGRWDQITGGKRMPPQQGSINDEDLKVVVDYIIALNIPKQATASTQTATKQTE
ncbi:MAG: c-type cytochrome [Gammaproteobacteria bacterium]|nr:c-type cytochrome [Gammaproteobacteria bacterium]